MCSLQNVGAVLEVGKALHHLGVDLLGRLLPAGGERLHDVRHFLCKCRLAFQFACSSQKKTLAVLTRVLFERLGVILLDEWFCVVDERDEHAKVRVE